MATISRYNEFTVQQRAILTERLMRADYFDRHVKQQKF